MMLLFVFMASIIGKKEALGFGTILCAHITFNLPYVILNVLPKLKQTDVHLSEAAEDLGCTPFKAFINCTRSDDSHSAHGEVITSLCF